MALASYNDLVASVQSWMLDRSDLAPMCGDFIALAEGDLNQQLRTRQQLTTVALTLDSNSQANLPEDYLALRQVTALTNPRRPLSVVAPSYADAELPYRLAGDPAYFTIDGETLTVMPTTASNIEFSYWAKIPALSVDNQTNWLLKKFPNIYLYGACMHAGFFIADSERTVGMATMFRSQLDALMAAEEMAMYSRAAARASGPTP